MQLRRAVSAGQVLGLELSAPESPLEPLLVLQLASPALQVGPQPAVSKTRPNAAKQASTARS